MARKTSTSATHALQVLTSGGIEFTVYEFAAGTHDFGAAAVAELASNGIDADQVFKTLLVDLTAGVGPKRRLGVCCVPVPEKLSLKKAARGFNVPKVVMAQRHDAEKSSGYVAGGISPIGQKTPLPTLIDETALLWDTVCVSGGRRGIDVALKPEDLAELTSATFVELV
ncbi:MAG: aminoacyl-tRNA deacylase [Corynebacterium sp.]|uniref:aminoacyl-tRNA deacylase n=1 Tax=Corynebacterium sp. TaxID=1720 RepID=UPI0026DB6CDC|nr:aminoacyl-tRNA deacylase [Corynebacterium sp.]MDO5097581.1 aminoacyl-tRNA deacylase [Corynebacterium sp.]